MNWILENPMTALHRAWDFALKDMCMVGAAVLVVWIFAAILFPKRKKVVRRPFIAVFIIAVLSVGFLNVYRHMATGNVRNYDAHPYHEQYSAHFNDVQKRQIAAARKYGISPVKNRKEAQDAIKSGTLPLVKLADCKAYELAPMGYSIPYLTSNAAEILEMIGRNFRDSLRTRGLSDHKIVVTSVLRTDEDVERLMKTNSVAVKNSAHRHATTFDISYVQYEPVWFGFNADRGELKKVLAQVLSDLRDQKLCYVKYEKNQNCFHITVRK